MVNAMKQIKDINQHFQVIEENKETKLDPEKPKIEKKPIVRENSYKNRKSDSKLVQVETKIEHKTNDKFQNIFTSRRVY
jgi:Asp-tRNA(Asn)/Glu-tRNA(Gln) amidotransferase C subunit